MENLRQASVAALAARLTEWGQPAFRAKQIHEWLWLKHAASFDEMSNLPKSLRETLAAHYFIPKVSIDHSQYSTDGTIKSRLRLFDQKFIEGVLIPAEKRVTACVSSQVGCSLSCKFCATGYLKRSRNLEFDEIVDEVTLLNAQAEQAYGRRLSNIVFMGMGEPLLNYKNVLKAIERITAPDGLGMSPRRITLSTAGVAKMIRQLGDDEVRFKLALSLHAANDQKRSRIMPINDSNNLEALIEAIHYFYQKTKTQVTLEYILFKDFNDQPQDAKELIRAYRRMPADLVNIIEYNAIDQADFSKPDPEVTDRFMAQLAAGGVNARLRRSRGKDIDAACGQLANIDRNPQI